jgi:hypothetical protein
LTSLACTNAHVHPGHHPRLAHLHAALASLRTVLPPEAWQVDWGDAHARLAHPAGIGRPPWDVSGVDDYLPAATSTGGENATEPLAEQTMGPLIIWAMRVVDDFFGHPRCLG